MTRSVPQNRRKQRKLRTIFWWNKVNFQIWRLTEPTRNVHILFKKVAKDIIYHLHYVKKVYCTSKFGQLKYKMKLISKFALQLLNKVFKIRLFLSFQTTILTQQRIIMWEKQQIYCQSGQVWLYPFLKVRLVLKISRLLTRVVGTVKHSFPNQIGNNFSQFDRSLFYYEVVLKGGETELNHSSEAVNSYFYLGFDGPKN